MYNIIQKLPHDMERKSVEVSYIARMKESLKNKDNKNNFSSCDDVFMYVQRVRTESSCSKANIATIPLVHRKFSRMNVLMTSFVYWLTIDRDIKKIVKAYGSCALTTKALPVKYQL